MFENEDLVTEVTENVEETATEETVEEIPEVEAEEVITEEKPPKKMFSEEEVHQMMGERVARERRKMQRENEAKYGRLENALRAGTGKQTVEEITNELETFYRNQGVDIPQRPAFSQKDVEVLAAADAKEIIELGYDEAVAEANRLNAMDMKEMTERDKAVFVKLVDHINDTRAGRELEKIGVHKDVYGSEEFKEFASKFNSKTPITEVYKIYNSTKPTKEFKTAGSLKQTAKADGAVKEYYSPEEAAKFSVDDFNKNPALYEAVCKSMSKWK